MYVLFSPNEYLVSDYKEKELYGFWSNEFGYTVLECATVFTDAEVTSRKYLPIGCIWVKLPEIKIGE